MQKIPIAAVRVAKGWTQQELADKMRVSRATVIDWENNKRNMRPAYVLSFCAITGFSEDDIILPKAIT